MGNQNTGSRSEARHGVVALAVFGHTELDPVPSSARTRMTPGTRTMLDHNKTRHSFKIRIGFSDRTVM